MDPQTELVNKVLQLEKLLQKLQRERIGKQNIIPGSIQQIHIAAGYALICFDVAANRPTQGNNNCLAFFATDTHVLSIWTNTAWKSVTLT